MPAALPSVAGAARNLAAWHACSVRALGIPERTTTSWWTCDLETPSIWFTAVALSPRVTSRSRPLRRLTRDPGLVAAVCDSWDSLDLREQGLRKERVGRWFGRPARLPAGTVPNAFAIEEVGSPASLAEYEHVAAVAFDVPFLPAPFEIHGRAILEDPAMHLWVARIGGEAVGGAMAYDQRGLRGVYGVGTIPAARGQGVATALTLHALADRPDVAATLQPSAAAESLYRRLGFVEIGRYGLWR